jgi:hypothetical protein
MPELAPVTSAICPCRSFCTGTFGITGAGK